MHIFCHANSFPPDCYTEFFEKYKNQIGVPIIPVTLTPIDRAFSMYETGKELA